MSIAAESGGSWENLLMVQRPGVPTAPELVLETDTGTTAMGAGAGGPRRRGPPAPKITDTRPR
ncbi:hypothetical protein ACFXA3_35135, partial [Streptomyces sp. NPDC059456]|uniref:hypothetical protein n=1 Tax=Streptomyces sp. NPDC059456 TaxID=3346838 RepID=UPI00367B39BB